jgi:hypothetical protein
MCCSGCSPSPHPCSVPVLGPYHNWIPAPCLYLPSYEFDQLYVMLCQDPIWGPQGPKTCHFRETGHNLLVAHLFFFFSFLFFFMIMLHRVYRLWQGVCCASDLFQEIHLSACGTCLLLILLSGLPRYINWLCSMMHEMHHSVLLAQRSCARIRSTPNNFILDPYTTHGIPIGIKCVDMKNILFSRP